MLGIIAQAVTGTGPLDLLAPGTSVAAVIAVVVLFLRHTSAWSERVREIAEETRTGHLEAQRAFEASLERQSRMHSEQVGLLVAGHQRTEELMASRLEQLAASQVRLEMAVQKLADRIQDDTKGTP